MMIAKSIVVKESVKSDGKETVYAIKHDLGGFCLRDRLEIKAWKPVFAAKEFIKHASSRMRKVNRIAPAKIFNEYVWQKESILEEKAIMKKSGKALSRAAAYSSLGAAHLMGIHENAKKNDDFEKMGVILPLIALNQYVWEGQKIPLTPARAVEAAKIAAELADTCDKYSSSWAREQLPGALEALETFLEKTSGMKGMEKERAAVRARLETGSPELDRMNAKEAVMTLIKQGDDCREECRDLIMKIRDPKIRDEAIKNAQEYWNSYWWSVGVQPELFPKEFLAALERIEIMKN